MLDPSLGAATVGARKQVTKTAGLHTQSRRQAGSVEYVAWGGRCDHPAYAPFSASSCMRGPSCSVADLREPNRFRCKVQRWSVCHQEMR
jgi:hypothetical protein